jgi:putative tricarboxylic transport membrane protein
MNKFKTSALVKGVFLGTLATAVVMAAPTTVRAEFPEKPVTALVGFGAGGGTDTYTRTVGKYFPKYFGKNLVVINKKGNAGQIALNEMAKVKADGYTFGPIQIPAYVIQPRVRKAGQKGFSNDQFEFLGTHARIPGALIVRKDSPFKTLADLVKFAKANPKKIIASAAGVASSNHAFLVRVEKMTGIKTTLVTYKGGGRILKALLGGEINVMAANAIWATRAKEETRTLAIASAERYPLNPDIPTFKDQGYDLVEYLTRTMVVPAGTPKDVLARLRKGMEDMSKDPEFVKDMANTGLVAKFMNAAETEAYCKNYIKNNGEMFDFFRNYGKKK